MVPLWSWYNNVKKKPHLKWILVGITENLVMNGHSLLITNSDRGFLCFFSSAFDLSFTMVSLKVAIGLEKIGCSSLNIHFRWGISMIFSAFDPSFTMVPLKVAIWLRNKNYFWVFSWWSLWLHLHFFNQVWHTKIPKN